MVTRQGTASAFVVLTFVLALLTGPTLYAGNVIQDEDRFVAVADRVIGHRSVRNAIAVQVTEITFDALAADEAIAKILPEQARTFSVPLTRLAANQITNGAFVLLNTDGAMRVRDSALREIHQQITRDADELTIDLRGVLVHTARELAGPTAGAGVAKLVSGSEIGRYTLAEEQSMEAELVAAARALPAIGTLLAFLTMLSLFGAIAIAADRRRTLLLGGLAVSTGALTSIVIVTVTLYATLGSTGSGATLGRALAEVFAADYVEQQRGAILTGILLAGIALLLGNRPSAVAIRSLPRRLWTRDQPGTIDAISSIIGDNPPLARLIVWLGAALIVVSWNAPTGRVLITVIVVTMTVQLTIWLFTGSGDLAARLRRTCRMPEPALAQIAGRRAVARNRANIATIAFVGFAFWPAWSQQVVTAFFAIVAVSMTLTDLPQARRFARANASTAVDPGLVSTPLWRRRKVLIPAVIVAAVLGGGLLTLASAEPVIADPGCNGSVELCDRAVSEIVFAGSHNSMSSTDLGWDLAMQTGDIVAQLNFGVRALLIDTHYWDRPGAVEGGNNGAAAAQIEAALDDDQPREGVWLCHGFCALGATELETALADINIWLDSNPREVVMLVIQDETSTDDVIEGFEKSALLSKVHNHVPGSPWPTLQQLIDSNQRIIVFAENEGRPDSWYQNVWENFTETPFEFAVRSEFSCAANRGDTDNPLFLLNHWVTTGIPVREAAAVVNSDSALRERVEECRTERGRLPNVIAVDFAQTGDLIAFVDELNADIAR